MCEEYIGDSKWVCRCDCGNTTIALTADLTTKKKKSCGCLKHKYKIDKAFFDSIDTEEKAYIIGFICADGCILRKTNNIKIEIHKKDVDVLEKIKTAMNYNYVLKYYSYLCKFKNGTSCMSDTARLNIVNKHMTDKLISYGVTPRKSNTLNFDMSLIDKKLIRHFLRGYWDGDGCIDIKRMKNRGILQLSVTSSSIMISKIISILKKEILDFAYTMQNRNPNNLENATLYVNRYAISLKVLHYLYDDSHIYMDRKYNAYLEAIKYEKNKLKK